MWPSLLCAPHHSILTEELELLDGRSPSGPTCVLLRPATRSEPSIKEISVRSGQVCPWHQHLLFRETAHLLHRGEGPPNTPPCRSPSSPFSLVSCSCYLFWDEAGGQGDWRRGKGEQKLSSTQASKPGFHGGVEVGSSTPHIPILSPQCGYVPFGAHVFLPPLPSKASVPAAFQNIILLVLRID